MQSIDFLPPHHRQPRAKLNIRLWVLLVVILFGGVISGTGITQSKAHHKVASELEQIELQKDMADLTRAKWVHINQRLQAGTNDAQLQTYLEHPWPKTGILEALVKNLPSTISFDHLLLAREENAPQANPPNEPRPSYAGEIDPQAALANLPPPAQDLQKLRERYDPCQLVIIITGRASEAVVVHRYIRQLNRESLIAKAELISLEEIPEREGIIESEFRLRIVITPPYGRANGPRGATSLLLDIAEK